MTRMLAPAMATTLRRDRLFRVALAALVISMPHTADAQLRSLLAIRYVTFAPPPPGLEQLHHDLAQGWRQLGKLVEEPETFDERLTRVKAFDTYEAVTADPRSHCARCRLRADLPPPRAIGLECSDYEGKYVGVVRFSTADELRRWFGLHARFSLPAGRPLTTVHVLVSGQSTSNSASSKTIEFMKDLLRSQGKFTVLDSDEGLSADERDHVVWFDLHEYGNTYSGSGRRFFTLTLNDRFGHAVRAFRDERPVRFFYAGSNKPAMRRIVDQMVAARREDEDIYRIPPPN